MERIGRGTLKILEACQAARLPTPEWTSDNGVTITLFAPLDLASVLAKLNERQQSLLDYLSPKEVIKPSDYFKGIAHEVSERQARRDLQELDKLSLLRREGLGPSTRYIRT